MSHSHLHFQPGPREGTLLNDSGEIVTPPEDWSFLPAGDAAITRKVKAAGPTWVVQLRRGRRLISQGIWASESDIKRAREDVAINRATPEYAQKREREMKRRHVRQQRYEEGFCSEVVRFLGFHAKHGKLARHIAEQITIHATPVGSGTVARTSRLPLAKRAEAAVIAWMRHKTTAYDSMKIARIKGNRRKVRRKLAADSLAILERYRKGMPPASGCPLAAAIYNHERGHLPTSESLKKEKP